MADKASLCCTRCLIDLPFLYSDSWDHDCFNGMIAHLHTNSAITLMFGHRRSLQMPVFVIETPALHIWIDLRAFSCVVSHITLVRLSTVSEGTCCIVWIAFVRLLCSSLPDIENDIVESTCRCAAWSMFDTCWLLPSLRRIFLTSITASNIRESISLDEEFAFPVASENKGGFTQPLDEFQKYSRHLANSKGQKLLPSEFARSKADLNY